MLVLFTNNHNLHAPKYEYYEGVRSAHAERPDRIAKILEQLQTMDVTIQEIDKLVSSDVVKTLHSKHYVDYLKQTCSEIKNDNEFIAANFIRDTYTPITRHAYEAALKSVQLGLSGADELVQGTQREVYALCRPPGHHAEYDGMSGYCYFNNAALAADQLSKSGKVAILDIDYHHGNGTQKLFYEREDVFYVSLHADPAHAFPYKTGFSEETGVGAGQGYNLNIPLDPETLPDTYLEALQGALSKIADFKADYLVLSLGFDTYENDPIGGLNIDEATYTLIGQKIAEQAQIPTLIIQEGGYNVSKLGTLAGNFIDGYLANR